MSAIKMGDLVVVAFARKECGCPDRVGSFFTVTKIRPLTTLNSCCGTCGYISPAHQQTLAEGHPSGTVGTHRLKRIPPLSELESEKKTDEVTA